MERKKEMMREIKCEGKKLNVKELGKFYGFCQMNAIKIQILVFKLQNKL